MFIFHGNVLQSSGGLQAAPSPKGCCERHHSGSPAGGLTPQSFAMGGLLSLAPLWVSVPYKLLCRRLMSRNALRTTPNVASSATIILQGCKNKTPHGNHLMVLIIRIHAHVLSFTMKQLSVTCANKISQRAASPGTSSFGFLCSKTTSVIAPHKQT